MSFSKSKKVLHEQNKYLPPPGYYEVFNSHSQSPPAASFSKGHRFEQKIKSSNPGPGSYLNIDKEIAKKRMLEQANHKINKQTKGSSNDIKISSIPSIPKKSATRVYEELAPGILILHEEQNTNPAIGPGSYEVNQSPVRKKVIGAKIHPQSKKRQPGEQEQEIEIPTLAQELREQRRLLYKQNLYKSSNVNKNSINSADLCLETIILREKLLRGEDHPPPGYYYNEDIYSIFKRPDEEKPFQLQALGGKQPRFKETENTSSLGPGSYLLKDPINKKGPIFSKGQRDQSANIDFLPGPGSYEFHPRQNIKEEPKGNYPPIFGSGTKRFYSVPKNQGLPGPGSYKLDKKCPKKVKYVKIRRDLCESQPSMGKNNEFKGFLGQIQSGQKGNYSTVQQKRLGQKNNHYFKSKVERFLGHNKKDSNTSPGQYQVSKSLTGNAAFNKSSYVGARGQRFDDNRIRPHLGPGTYY